MSASVRLLHCLVAAVLLVPSPGCAQAPPAAAPELTAAPGWRAAQIHQADSGVWYLHVDKVIDAYGANEVIAADDKGRHLLLSVYSAQWTVHSATPDGLWLAPTKSADVDPRVPGRELYAAGRGGSVHRTILRPLPFAKFALESLEIGHAAGEEFHAVLAADLSPAEPGDELLAFGITGAVFRLQATGDGHAFTMTHVGTVPGRVRDTVVLPPAAAGESPRIVGASRSGDLLEMRLSPAGLSHRVLLHEDSGLGRVAVSPVLPDVIYATRDDGLVLRVTLRGDQAPDREAIFASGEGPRGVAAGKFFADGREAVAVYGYDRHVHLVARRPDGAFEATVLFTGAQRGHWICAGELDGRNGTDELIASGFDGQVVLLAREPGHGLPGAALPGAALPGATRAPGDVAPGERSLRLAARFGPRAAEQMSPLCYQGGFETKSMVYETLVRRGADGRIGLGLAETFRTAPDGKSVTFTLRQDATFHDGRPVTAGDVATHFRRWVGLPEHDWLRCNRRIVAVRAEGPRDVIVELDRPHNLLPDLCAINPTAIRGPGALTREGEFVRAIGSGPFVFGEVRDEGRTLRYRRHGGAEVIDLVRCEDALDALQRGEIDAVVGSWLVTVDPARAGALRDDPRVQIVDGPGSSVRHLALRFDSGPLASLERRRAVAAAIDRAALVRDVLHGFGDVCTGWAAPSVVDWPAGVASPPATATFERPLRLLAAPADEPLARCVILQLQARGIGAELVAAPAGDQWDMRLERTHGVPYDPVVTLVERFAAAADPELAQLVAALSATPGETEQIALYAQVQRRLDQFVPIVPLFAPRRIAVVAKGLPLPALTHDMYHIDAAWLAAAFAARAR